MNCDEAKPLLNAYLDRQLDAANTLAIEKHLSRCPGCQAIYDEQITLRQSIRDALTYHHAPQGLHNNIMSQLSADGEVVGTKAGWKLPYLKTGLSFAASLLLGYVIVTTYFHHRTEEVLIDAILSSHINALSANRLTDVQGSNAGALIPWLNSKLDYSPKVYNFTEQGFDLLGARLDTLPRQRVASLTYQHEHHLVNVYTWPSPDVDDAEVETHYKQGYNLIYWCQNKMNYWVVSDMDQQELQAFSQEIQRHLASVKNGD